MADRIYLSSARRAGVTSARLSTLLAALWVYPKRNPHQLQAAKVCAGVEKLATSLLVEHLRHGRAGVVVVTPSDHVPELIIAVDRMRKALEAIADEQSASSATEAADRFQSIARVALASAEVPHG